MSEDPKCELCGHTLEDHDLGGWTCDCPCPRKAKVWELWTKLEADKTAIKAQIKANRKARKTGLR